MLTNRDIRVSTSGFSADPQKYNLNSSMDGNVKTQIFYNKQKEYLLMAKSTSGAPNNATEVYRQSILPESGYYIRKISYNSPARAENANLSLNLCELIKADFSYKSSEPFHTHQSNLRKNYCRHIALVRKSVIVVSRFWLTGKW